MIITVTMNPCIDKHITVDRLELGQTCKAFDEQAIVAGKGVNVARTLKAMGRQVLCLGLARENDREFLTKDLNEAMIAEDFVFDKGNLRVNLKIHTPNGITTEINNKGSSVSAQMIESVADKILNVADQSELVLLCGSLPIGAPAGFYADIIKKLRDKGIECAVDTSSNALSNAIKASPVMIKPNIDELRHFSGKKLDDIDAVSSEALLICQNYGIKYTIVSLGARGSLIADGKSVYIAKAPDVSVVNTTGAGDAMLAGLAVAYTRGLDTKSILQMGVATSGVMISKQPNEAFDYKKVRTLLPDIKVIKYI